MAMGGGDALKKRMAALRKEQHAKCQRDLREQRRLDKARRAQPRTFLLERFRHRWWFRATEWTFGIVVAAMGIVATIAGIWGPIWPTDPEIHPHDVVDGSSFILPFTVKNRSIIFDMPNVEFTC